MTVHPAVIGKFFEDFTIGDVYQHPFGRTISETDNSWFTLLTINTNQNHFNAHFAENNPITDGKVIVNSGLTVAMVLGLSVIDVSQNAIVNLGWTDIALTHPVYVGDTLYSESVILDARESKSRPYAGIITVRTRGLNQDGDEVVSWTRSVMVWKRDAGTAHDHFPQAKTGPLSVEHGRGAGA
jgi:itaconyl-CoA hydratase